MAKFLRRCLPVLTLIALTALANAAGPHRVPRNTVGKTGSGIFRGKRVSYVMVNGRMMFDGDIVLDHVQPMVFGGANAGGTIDYLQYRWPLAGNVYQIPYMLDAASGDVANINAAISTYNSLLAGVVQWVPYTNQADYVDFDLTDTSGSGEGFSSIGRAGGKQIIGGAANCTVATLLHEMGHATGMWHEQARPDRDSYVTINIHNMVTTAYSNSEIQFDDMQLMGLYDWSSLMEYFPANFSKDGSTVIETIPAGMPLSNYVGYSAGDVDAIKRLYGAAPAAVTIATNPAGLQVVVDGVTVTTPQTYNWPLFSTHTLSVAATVQTQAGTIAGSSTPTTFYYDFGRWNDSGAETHTITVLPGIGTLASPATTPAATVYEASFVQLVPYTNAVYPANAGTVTPNPAPQPYSGVGGVYYAARQPITLTTSPNSGWNFYQYIDSPYWVEGGLSANPKSFLVPDTGNPLNFTTYFVPTTSPIFTFDSNPDGSQFYVILDLGYWPAPVSFSPYYDSSWNVGTSHTMAVPNPEYPWTLNTRYAFQSWSDSGALSHSITMPSSSTAYTATLQPQFYLSEYANEGCAGTVSVSPPSPTGDSYYPTGTGLTFAAAANTGWTFTQWEQNLSGTTNPLSVTMNDEITGIADFNTIVTPLAVTSLSPAAAVAGSSPFTMTINGTGFTPGPNGTVVFVNNTFVANTFVSANKITVPITAANLATAGGEQVFAENFPSGASCAAYQALPFNVAHAPLVTPTPQTLAFGAVPVGSGSAAKVVTFKNSSTSTVNIDSLTASGNYYLTSTTCGATLKAGASCTAHVYLNPSNTGSLSGSLAMTDSAPDSPQIVTLSGTGTLPLTLAPATLAFGSEAVGTTSAAKMATVTNNQASTLNFTFAASGDYAVSATGTTCTGSLAAAAKCNIAVTFTPTEAGTVNGSLAITDTTVIRPQIVQLSGTGTGGATPPLTFTPATETFAVQAVGTTSPAKTVTLKNTSANTIAISSIAGSGDFVVAGSGTRPCGAGLKLAANAACTLTVAFAPALGTNGVINGAVIVTDDASAGQQVLDAKGTAAQPVSFSPATLTFAPQSVATAAAAQTVTLTNNLSTTLTLTITGNGDYAAAAGGANPCSGALAAHTKCTFNVTFTPSAIGLRPSAITVTDSGNPNVQTMNVTGTGQ